MNKYFYFITLSVLAFSAMATKASPREALALSQKQFDQGQYAKALTLLDNLDVRADLDSSEEMIAALKIRAISYAQTGKDEHARDAIRELFFIDPSFKFEPFDTPAPVVALAKSELKAIAEKNQQLALIKPPSIANITSITSEEKSPAQKSLFLAFMPLGINHFYAGSHTKGSVYLGVQALSLLTNITAFWWKQSYLEKFGSPHLALGSQRKDFHRAQITQYVALSAFIAALGASIVDALVSL